MRAMVAQEEAGQKPPPACAAMREPCACMGGLPLCPPRAADARVAFGGAQRVVDQFSQRKSQGVVSLGRKVLVVAGHGEGLGVRVEAYALLWRRAEAWRRRRVANVSAPGSEGRRWLAAASVAQAVPRD